MASCPRTCPSFLAQVVTGVDSGVVWCKDEAYLKIGDIVIVMSTDTPRGKWPLGRIVKVFPGRDSRVRVVDAQVGKTVFRRPTVKLC